MNWDYIIVGAGSAGCVLANRLSADPRHNILLIEAGGSKRSPFIFIPAGEAKAIGSARFNWKFTGEPDPSLLGRRDPWPAGKVQGGSSSINGMIYLRGQREDYDGWARLGNPGWSYDEVLPYFKASEDNDLGPSEYHARGGPLAVSTIATPHRLAKTFIQAAVELGCPPNPDLNGVRQEGAGPIQGTIRRGRRRNTATSFLDPVRRRDNLKVVSHATVERVLLTQGRATGVVYTRDGRQHAEHTDGEVIVSAGALMSPLILMRSGIGPGAHLAAHGIDVVQDSPAVGQGLQEHAVVWASAYVNVSTYNTELALHKGVTHGLNWLLFGRGPAGTPIAHAAAFVKSHPGMATADLQLSFVPTGYTLDAEGLKFLDRPAIVIAVNKCRPESRSHLELRSADPNDGPRILSNILGARRDVDDTILGLQMARRLFHTNAFRPYFVAPCSPGPEVESLEQYEQYVRASAGPAYHPSGTCRMGTDARAVVDPRLRVKGVRGLRIADASIMPALPSANTNAPSIMIGEKAAAMIIADRRLQ